MIGIIFQYASEVVEVRVDGVIVTFRTGQSAGFVTIDELKLSKAGVIKEFPDLINNQNWQKIARERFKDKIKDYNTEMERANYIIEDLRRYGYQPLYIQRQGFRTQRIQ